MHRVNGRAGVACVGLVGMAMALVSGCGGSAQSSQGTGAGDGTATNVSAGGESTGAGGESAGAGEGGAQRTRSGLSIHIQNLRISGNLPEAESPTYDGLEVSFELQFDHNGTEPLSGVAVQGAKLVHDDGREINFGVLTDWDGRLDVGEHRVVLFRKTPDSASPRPSRNICGQGMRLDVGVELAGRQARSVSRRVRVECGSGTPTP